MYSIVYWKCYIVVLGNAAIIHYYLILSVGKFITRVNTMLDKEIVHNRKIERDREKNDDRGR